MHLVLQVSDRAKKRGKTQLGTLGAGNHYVEVQVTLPSLGIWCCSGHVQNSATLLSSRDIEKFCTF